MASFFRQTCKQTGLLLLVLMFRFTFTNELAFSVFTLSDQVARYKRGNLNLNLKDLIINYQSAADQQDDKCGVLIPRKKDGIFTNRTKITVASIEL